jgi:uncharacterized protein
MNVWPRSVFAIYLLCSAAAPADPSAPPQADRRLATVSGRGEISAAPDRARLSMAVEQTDPDLKAAQAKVNGVVRAYLARLRNLGLKDEDISTAGLSIRSEYDYSNNNGASKRKFVGYHVTRGIEVVVRDLERIGEVLQGATDAGINNVSDPQLESSHADELQNQALVKAAQDAQAKARLLADTLGVKLGAVHTISSNFEMPRPPQPMPRMMVMAAAAAPSGNEEMGFAAGQIRFTSSVEAEFDLLP